MAVIETVYRVRCSGPCRRYLSASPMVVTTYPSQEAAYAAAKGVGWSDCTEHAGHLLYPGDDPACLTTCPECRKAAGEG